MAARLGPVNAATGTSVSIIGAPLDLGQSRRGVDIEPSAIRYAGLEERLDSIGAPRGTTRQRRQRRTEALHSRQDERARYLSDILDACARIAVRSMTRCPTANTARARRRPLRRALGRSPVSPGGRAPREGCSDVDAPRRSESDPRRAQRGTCTRHCPSRPPSASEPVGCGTTAPPACVRSCARRDDRRRRSLDTAERDLIRTPTACGLHDEQIDRIGIERAMTRRSPASPGRLRRRLARPRRSRPGGGAGVGTPVRGGLTYRGGTPRRPSSSRSRATPARSRSSRRTRSSTGRTRRRSRRSSSLRAPSARRFCNVAPRSAGRSASATRARPGTPAIPSSPTYCPSRSAAPDRIASIGSGPSQGARQHAGGVDGDVPPLVERRCPPDDRRRPRRRVTAKPAPSSGCGAWPGRRGGTARRVRV